MKLWQIDRPTNGHDIPSYRDARIHLMICSGLFLAFTGFSLLKNIDFSCSLQKRGRILKAKNWPKKMEQKKMSVATMHPRRLTCCVSWRVEGAWEGPWLSDSDVVDAPLWHKLRVEGSLRYLVTWEPICEFLGIEGILWRDGLCLKGIFFSNTLSSNGRSNGVFMWPLAILSTIQYVSIYGTVHVRGNTDKLEEPVKRELNVTRSWNFLRLQSSAAWKSSVFWLFASLD